MSSRTHEKINIYSEEDFVYLRKSGKLVKKTLDYIETYIKPGVSTAKLDDLCHNFIITKGGRPACLNYKGYPKSVCTSINEVACHGIPNKKVFLKDGDIINIDIVVELNGFYGDASRMYKVGNVSELASKLINVTYDALWIGIETLSQPNVTLGDLGYKIQSFVENAGFSVVRDYCGHGIGKNMHEDPTILHYGEPKTGLLIKPGMVFTIEPIINTGKHDVKMLRDNWTIVTVDNSLSAQWEHTIGIKNNGSYEIFTN